MSISAATGVVGGTMQAIAAQQEQKAMFKAYQDELKRQGAFQQQATGLFDQGLAKQGSEAAAGYRQRGAAQRESDYARVNATPLTYGPGPTKEDQAYLSMMGQNRADLGSYSDMLNAQAINQLRTGQQLGRVSNYAAGQAGVFPYKMYQAQHSMDELMFWGNLISSMGGAASNMAQLYGVNTNLIGGGGGGGGQLNQVMGDPSSFGGQAYPSDISPGMASLGFY